MGRTRATDRAEELERIEREEAATRIALLIGGGAAASSAVAGGTLVAAVALLLLLSAPAALFRRQDSEADEIARHVARLVVTGYDARPTGERMESLLYRAWYGVNAVRRVAASEDVRQALKKERVYFRAHRRAEAHREAGRRALEATVEAYGPVLGWRHGNPREPRPKHQAADGWNFDVRSPPRLTGVYPGVLPECTCRAVAPFAGAGKMK